MTTSRMLVTPSANRWLLVAGVLGAVLTVTVVGGWVYGRVTSDVHASAVRLGISK